MYLQRLACIYQPAECSRALCMIVNFFKKGKKKYQQLNIEFFFNIPLSWKRAAREAQEKHVDALYASQCKQRATGNGPALHQPAAATGHPGQRGVAGGVAVWQSKFGQAVFQRMSA